MASDLEWLLLLAVGMFVGSFIAGSIPLAFQLSEERLKLVSSYGAGILVGTALIVILPEGVATLYGEGIEHCLDSKDHPHESEHFAAEKFMGLAIVLGFLIMFLIDFFGTSYSFGQEEHTKSLNSAFLGLIVHAAADGIALGAAAIGNNPHLEIVVFVAIMLHKAPGSFGLATYLLHEGLARNKVRGYLALFSLAAPISCLATYLLLSGYQFETPQHIWTGYVLLFSAGSFLYVATIHVLPEITQDHDHNHTHTSTHKKQLSKSQAAAIVAGMITPLFLRIEHSH